MTDKTTRRHLLRRWTQAFAVAATGAAIGTPCPNAAGIGDAAQLQVDAPAQVAAGKPLTVRLTVPANGGAEAPHWLEVWLIDREGQRLLSRMELGGAAVTATLTLTLQRSATLRVRDMRGRILQRRIQVR